MKLVQEHQKVSQLKRMRAAVLEGDWVEVEKLSAKRASGGANDQQQHRSFLYAIYREQYLELLEGGEYHKARIDSPLSNRPPSQIDPPLK